jgi:outer membrane protein
MFIRERVEMDINRSYVQTILNKQILKIRKENFELGKVELDRVKARYEAGLTSVNFVYSQEADLGNRELDIVKAENDLKIARTGLLILMGLNPETEAYFSTESLPNNIDTMEIAEFARQIGTFENAVKIAIENRKDVHARHKQIEAAKKQITISQSTYWPTLTANGGWSWSNYYVEDFSKLGFSSIGLNLSIPVFENFRTNLNIENAKLQLFTKETELHNIEQSIRQNLRTAILNLKAAEKQLEITNRSLVYAQKNYEFSKERYRVGSSNVSDFFIANNLLVTTQINRINAIYSYFVAKKEVLFTLGLLNK